jgi:hypothetical protein
MGLPIRVALGKPGSPSPVIARNSAAKRVGRDEAISQGPQIATSNLK